MSVVSISSISIIHDPETGENYLEVSGNYSDVSSPHSIWIGYGVNNLGMSLHAVDPDIDEFGNFTLRGLISSTAGSGTFKINMVQAQDAAGNVLEFDGSQIAALNEIAPDYYEKVPNSTDNDAPVVSISSISIIHDPETGENYLEVSGNYSDVSSPHSIWIGYGVNNLGMSLHAVDPDIDEFGNFTLRGLISSTAGSGTFKINMVQAQDAAGNVLEFDGSQIAALNEIAPDYYEKVPNSTDNDAPVVSISSISIIHDPETGENYLEVSGNYSDVSSPHSIWIGYGVNNLGMSLHAVDPDIDEFGNFTLRGLISSTAGSGTFKINMVQAQDAAGNVLEFDGSQIAALNEIAPDYYEKVPNSIPLFDIEAFPYDQTNSGELKKVSDNTGSSDLVIETGAGFEIVTTRNVPPYEQGHGNGFAIITDENTSQKLIAYAVPTGDGWDLYATLWYPLDGIYTEIFSEVELASEINSANAVPLGGDQAIVNMADLGDGKFGVNLAKFDDFGVFHQLKYAEVSLDGAGKITEESASVEFPGYEMSDHKEVGEDVILGADADIFYGEGNADYVETGGGSDTIHTGAGDDVVVVQGQGDVEVDTGVGADVVEVERDFVGDIKIQNGAGSNDEPSSIVVAVDDVVWGLQTVGDSDVRIGLNNNENEILLKDYFIVDEDGYTTTNGISVRMEGWEYWSYNYDDKIYDFVRGSENSDRLYTAAFDQDPNDGSAPEVEDGIVYSISGWEGDDLLYVGGGLNQIWGGAGKDAFYLSAASQTTSIVADREIDTNNGQTNLKANGLPDYTTENTDFGDSVYLGWLESEVTLKELYGPGGNNYFRITTNDGQSVVDLYDVEKLYFSDYVDEQDFKALTNGRVIGKDDWFGAANGVDIDYHQANVSFEIDGSIIRVKASGSAIVTEEMFETETLWQIGGNQYKQSDYPSLTLAQWQGYGGVVVDEYEVSLGIQTYEKVFEDELIWEGERTEVDYFDFAGSVDVNVVNVSPEDTAGDPIFGAPGTTEGIDLVFGTADADFIDGRGGDDIIFGGGGDDVIIGGDGDDVIIGGDGSDILRGDSIDSNDAAYAAWQAGIAEFNAANPNNTVTFDENMLSIDNSGTNAGDGNDVIVGGDGLDDIKSGDGQNFVTSGKADIDGDGQANLDLINQNIENHQHLLDDEDWV